MGFIISLLKQKILSSYFDIVIEHDCYIFKLLADLWFMAKRININKEEISFKLLTKITSFSILMLLRNKITIIMLHSDYNSIYDRCQMRGSPIEPAKYINFQYNFYDDLANLISRSVKSDSIAIHHIDVNQSINDIHTEILSYVNDV